MGFRPENRIPQAERRRLLHRLQQLTDPGFLEAQRIPGCRPAARTPLRPRFRVSAGRAPDNTIQFWDARSGQPLAVRNHGTRPIGDVAFSPDGRRLAASIGQVVKIWDVETWEEEALRTGVHSCTHLSFSPDGSRIVSGGTSGDIKVWNGHPLEVPRALRGHAKEVRDVVVSAGGQRIYSASDDGTIRVWDGPARSEIATWAAHQERVCTLDLNPDGSRLARIFHHCLRTRGGAEGLWGGVRVWACGGWSA